MVGRNKLIAVAKKVVSDSLGLVDFAIRLVNSVHNLPNWQVIFWENSNYRRAAINPAHHFFPQAS